MRKGRRCRGSITPRSPFERQVTRREFLQTLALSAAGMALGSCSSSGSGSRPVVAIAKADSYAPALVREQVQAVLDAVGGLGDVLRHGNRVALKVNLTGGVSSTGLAGIPETESYLTHPEVVKALCELLRDAGVRDIFIVEAVYEEESWSHYGYIEVADWVDARLVNLNEADPYAGFLQQPVSAPIVYDRFTFNPVLEEVDAFISVAKMKCHSSCGVTHSVKNLIGLVPCRFYTLSPEDNFRTAFHGQESEEITRLPGVIIDLNRTRPVNLALIDGIWTVEGGEGPWVEGIAQVKPGLLFAGKDPVATDAVATAAMGFDPEAEYPNEPFTRAHNHLNMAHSFGLGTNRLANIDVVGTSLADVAVSFRPCRSELASRPYCSGHRFA
jgi:uncharacterized protein (DUF362 family)